MPVMARKFDFDHILLGRLSLSLAAGLLITACTTTQAPAPTRGPGPVVERPPVDTAPQTQSDPDAKTPNTTTDTNTPSDSSKEPETTAPTDQTSTEAAPVFTRDGVTPPHMNGRNVKRLALMLPLSSGSARLRAEANSMLKAAELAVFDHPEADIVLIALDSQGTEDGAKAAAKAAAKAGADVILGPILSDSVKAASKEARRSDIPVIAFSTDQTAAGRGTYLLSFPPEAEVDRIVEYVASEGVTRFAYIGPNSEYGQRANSEYQQAVARAGGQITASETYSGRDITVMQEPAARIASFYVEREKETRGQGEQAFQAIMLPEGGTPLRSLAPLLLYNNINNSAVQFMGTGLWNRQDTAKEPALNGGIFAGPDKESRARFADKYDRTYDGEPSSLATLAYDAVIAGVIIADGDPRARRARAEDPQGFYGADGLVRFRSDGTPDRGLAIYRIESGQFVVVEPAPKSAVGAF